MSEQISNLPWTSSWFAGTVATMEGAGPPLAGAALGLLTAGGDEGWPAVAEAVGTALALGVAGRAEALALGLEVDDEHAENRNRDARAMAPNERDSRIGSHPHVVGRRLERARVQRSFPGQWPRAYHPARSG